MGYTVSLFIAPTGTLEQALREGELRPTHPWAARVTDTARQARRVADAIAAGGRALDDEATAFVAAAIAETGHLLGELFHTSGGGERFRTEVLGGVLAPRFGAERIARLLTGPIAGCTFPEYPTAGLWSPVDVAGALAAAVGIGDDDLDDDDARDTHLLREVTRRAATTGSDVLGVYA